MRNDDVFSPTHPQTFPTVDFQSSRLSVIILDRVEDVTVPMQRLRESFFRRSLRLQPRPGSYVLNLPPQTTSLTRWGHPPGRSWRNDSFGLFPGDGWIWWNRPNKQRSKRTRVQSDGGGGSPLTIRPSGPREQFLWSRWAKSLELGKRWREPKWLQRHSPH